MNSYLEERIRRSHIAEYDRLAKEFEYSGDIAQSILYLKKIIMITPNDSGTYKRLGKLYFESGNIVDSVICYRNSVSLDPRNTDALYALGAVSAAAGIFEESIDSYEKYIQFFPDSLDAIHGLAWSLGKMGESTNDHDFFIRAVNVSKKGLTLKKDDPKCLFLLACSLMCLKDYESSIEYFRAYLVQQPNDFKGWCQLGLAEMNHGNKTAATEAYAKSVEINPDDISIRVLYIHSLIVAELYHIALEQINDIRNHAAGNIDLAIQLGYILIRSGKYNDAILELEKLSTVFPEDKTLPILLSDARARLTYFGDDRVRA
jgi:tetratricopeptide (TPR) repeat protein